jgi:alpha-1,2-mannosyltransferase
MQNRFNIRLHAPTIAFLYLSTRRWVLASTWPHFTLAGQSFGSILLAWDAFSLLVPDIFIDTMGYAFALGLSRFLFRNMPTGAYVHYPTISTDMLDSLDPASATGQQGVNAGQGVGTRGTVKKLYWRLFSRLYSSMGSTIDVVMTNSTWTQNHIQQLWGPLRQKKARSRDIAVVYPPVAVRELEQEVEVSAASEKLRNKSLVYIAQFRPEKNHQLILQAFAEFVRTGTPAAKEARLILIGSVRDDSDSKRVYKLRLLVNELHIKDQVEFHLDASWPEILEWLRKASVGVNGMWNEHFGIGVVEYQAAGLIAVVHNSGGPKLDIVTEIDGQPTGKTLPLSCVWACNGHSLSCAQGSMPARRPTSAVLLSKPSLSRTRWPCANGLDNLRSGSRKRSLRGSGRRKWRSWLR